MKLELIHWHSESRSGLFFKVEIYQRKNSEGKRFFFGIDRLSDRGPVRITGDQPQGPYVSPGIALQAASSWLDGWTSQSARRQNGLRRRRLVPA